MKSTPCTVLKDMSQYPFMFSLRCGAKTRQGTFCKAPAIKNKSRCRMHGGKGSGAPKANKNALKHGYYISSSVKHRKDIKNLINECKDLLKKI